ncbi:unnamed protein product [Ambrosiozyma monospora]|uniref:Unnamed protein product n=1 Tax=Ambrosiozyma monospora TaxID=43982 RepID=A0ACB5T4Z6_AMBMO|nr:unnamed protein product [Ambrosiozyma monospora]
MLSSVTFFTLASLFAGQALGSPLSYYTGASSVFHAPAQSTVEPAASVSNVVYPTSTSFAPLTTPAVYAYQNSCEGYFQVNIPADLAPFSFEAYPQFDFDTDLFYISNGDESTSIGSLDYAPSSATFAYNRSDCSDVAVGLGVVIPTTSTTYDAAFTVYPENGSSLTISATLTIAPPEETKVTVQLTGDILEDVQTTAITEYASLSTSSGCASPEITVPVVTVAIAAPVDYTLSKVSYSAYGKDIKYLTDGAYFEGIANNSTETLTDACITVNDQSLFEATLELSTSYESVIFRAQASNANKATYLAQVTGTYEYYTVADVFTADANAGVQKRLAIGQVPNLVFEGYLDAQGIIGGHGTKSATTSAAPPPSVVQLNGAGKNYNMEKISLISSLCAAAVGIIALL